MFLSVNKYVENNTAKYLEVNTISAIFNTEHGTRNTEHGTKNLLITIF